MEDISPASASAPAPAADVPAAEAAATTAAEAESDSVLGDKIIIDGTPEFGSSEDWTNRCRDFLKRTEADVVIGKTSALQRNALTCDQLMRRNLEIRLRQYEIDAILDSDDVNEAMLESLEEESDDLAGESDDIEELLQEKFRIPGGCRLWIERALLETSSMYGYGCGNAERARSNFKISDDDRWNEEFERAAKCRSDIDDMWKDGELRLANEAYERLEEQGLQRIERSRNGKKRKRVAAVEQPRSLSEYSWDVGSLSIRFPASKASPQSSSSSQILFDSQQVQIHGQIWKAPEGGWTSNHAIGSLNILKRKRSIVCNASICFREDDDEQSDDVDVQIRVWIHCSLVMCSRKGPVIDRAQRHALATLLQSCERGCGALMYDEPVVTDRQFAPEQYSGLGMELLASVFDKIRPGNSQEFAPGNAIKTQLKRFQRRACYWMLDREKAAAQRSFVNPCWKLFDVPLPPVESDSSSISPSICVAYNPYSWQMQIVDRSDYFPPTFPDVCGGILAEEMGLGKTLEVLVLIDSHRRGLSSVEYTMYGLRKISTTLVVAPANILTQWREEAAMHCPSMRVLLYTGSETVDFDDFDLVVTTFEVLRAQVHYNKEERPLRSEKKYKIPTTPLLEVQFWRFVIDEAQEVENTLKQTAVMASRISSVFRWCVSGTPVGKAGVDDLAGLFAFLHYQPFDERRVITEMLMCSERQLTQCLQRLLWRNTKADVIDELPIKALHRRDFRLVFSPIEREMYAQVARSVRLHVREADALDSLQQRSHLCWRLLDQLRHACCLPRVVGAGRELQNHVAMSMESVAVTLKQLALEEAMTAERELCKALHCLARRCFQLNDELAAAHSVTPSVSGTGDTGAADAATHSVSGTGDTGAADTVTDTVTDTVMDAAEVSSAAQRRDRKARAALVRAWYIIQVGFPRAAAIDCDACDKLDLGESMVTGDSQFLAWTPIEVCNALLLKRYFHTVYTTAVREERKQLHIELSHLWGIKKDSPSAFQKRFDELQARDRELLGKPCDQEIELDLGECIARLEDDYCFAQKSTLKKLAARIQVYEENIVKFLESSAPEAVQLAQKRLDIGAATFDARHLGAVMRTQAGLERDAQLHARRLECHRALNVHDAVDTLLQRCTSHDAALKWALLGDLRAFMSKPPPAFERSAWQGPRHRPALHVVTTRVAKMLRKVAAAFAKQLHASAALVEDVSALIDQVGPEAARDDIASSWMRSKDGITLCRNIRNIAQDRDDVRATLDEIDRRLAFLRLGLDEDLKDASIMSLERTVARLHTKASAKHGRCRYLEYRFHSSRSRRHRDEDEGDDADGNDDGGKTVECAARLLGSRNRSIEGRLDIQKAQQDEFADVELDCGVCLGKAAEPVFTQCGHLFCQLCLRFSKCPVCQTRLSPEGLFKLEVSSGAAARDSELQAVLASQPMQGEALFSSKIVALVKHILHELAADPRAKSLVFSSFRDVLDVVAQALGKNSIAFAHLSGSASHRAAVVERFQHRSSGVSVLLLRLRGDASGLNLHAARTVYVLEPSTNVAVEQQAVNRVHRMGQTRDTRVFRFIVDDTVEQHIVALQCQQQGLAGRALQVQRERSDATVDHILHKL